MAFKLGKDRLYLLILTTAAAAFGLYVIKRILQEIPNNAIVNNTPTDGRQKKKKLVILYGTTTGTTKNLANQMGKKLSPLLHSVVIKSFEEYDLETYLHKERYVVILISTWTNGSPPISCQPFFDAVKDILHDFRYSKDHLSKLQFAVLGLGAKVYGDNFCRPAIELRDIFLQLGGSELLPLLLCDDADDIEKHFNSWSCKLFSKLELTEDKEVKKPWLMNKVPKMPKYRMKIVQSNVTASKRILSPIKEGNIDDEMDVIEEEEEDIINNEFVTMDMADSCDESNDEKGGEDEVEDVEDMGSAIAAGSVKNNAVSSDREMVTRLQRKALMKEGYQIIGTHSAVKLCRWTKNQLRGRGGCYKHSFYGITSYQCMEATPSLACANKCVFCWRHHKNPVGTEWRWKEDSPDYIVAEAISLHQGMIKQMRGVPGVQPSRLEEAFTVKHCALSLVGEPIMYPRINELLDELHTRGISTFLVTNAQFPDCITTLNPVTQLYVSIDAPTKDSLKAIDRPLFKDYWERYLDSLVKLKEKQQRTVYRLTLVKSWNMNDVQEYANLIELGEPDFIEIKAVTYCGKSDASSLTMENVPWHHEVCSYSEAIAAELNRREQVPFYSIATEHEHSCIVLLAREDKFKVNGVWNTWIDYDKFNDLVRAYHESGKVMEFTSQEYMAPTPEWALYKSVSRGFDPAENRFRRGKNGEAVEIEYKASESGCG